MDVVTLEANLVDGNRIVGNPAFLGLPAEIRGPGAAAQAHQPNGFASVAQLDDCARLLGEVADGAERG